MKRNAAELLRKIADQIEQHPESYDQGCFWNPVRECGCIAGWAWKLRRKSRWRASCTEPLSVSLGIDGPELLLFEDFWRPRKGLTVSDALRMIADGASVAEVSR